MSVADLHDLELVWPSLRPTDVIVTGTFDQWTSSVHLVKDDTGFSGTVKVPWGQRIAYKYIVDGLWRCREDQPQEDDGHGNINNVLRTPEKPLPLAQGPPARLFIPFEGLQSEGHGDLENMVTAVEFLPTAEPTTTKSLPLLVPLITVEGLGKVPLPVTPMSESKLDTAAATEGHVSLTSETNQALPSCDVPKFVFDNGLASLPFVNGSGEVHGSSDIRMPVPVPIRFSETESPPSTSASEIAKEAAILPLGPTASQYNRPLPAVQDLSGITYRLDVTPDSASAAVPEFNGKQPEADAVGSAIQGQAAAPASISQASTPPSSTLVHKKRRSLIARIKHIFNKDNDKRGKKENKH